MPAGRTAAVLTVGTEITTGLRLDTNTRDIASALLKAGYFVAETVSLPDDATSVMSALKRLTSLYGLVVVTGGLGPTHDDITREATADALGLPLRPDPDTEHALAGWASRQGSAEATLRVLRQALVMEGATVIPASTGTAPGQFVEASTGAMVLLLPGPPHEMAPMLAEFLGPQMSGVPPHELSCTGITESDAQMIAQDVLLEHPGVTLALLAKPADVRVVLLDDGAGRESLAAAASAVRDALGAACYADDGSTLAQVVVRTAGERGLTIATAESCTGGLVGGALTDVAGSSAVYLGGMIAYANSAKTALLNVPGDVLDAHGTVSPQTAERMAENARVTLSSDIAVSITGIAGPSGGTPEKPTGLVWFGVSTHRGTSAVSRVLHGDRDGVRSRATIMALDLLRTTMKEM